MTPDFTLQVKIVTLSLFSLYILVNISSPQMISGSQEAESHSAAVMTSSVTGRMGKVRHNSLNQSDGPPPLRPPHTNNNAFVCGCTPLARSHTHTHTPDTLKQSKAEHPTLFQKVTKGEKEAGHQI